MMQSFTRSRKVSLEMATLGNSFEILLTCGDLTKNSRRFNQETKFEQIQEYVQECFQEYLPQSHRIAYYDSRAMKFVDLEEQLRSGSSPFHNHSPSSIGVQSTASLVDCLQLYVVSDHSFPLSVNESGQRVPTVSDNPESNLSNSSLFTHDETSDDLSNEDEAEVQDMLTRLSFTLDVKPCQRDIYKSDQFSVRSNVSIGRIARVQGCKTASQKMLQVLPKLRIPRTYLQANVQLLVAVVYEKIEERMRIWYKYPHKGFLPEGYTKETQPINPIYLSLAQNISTDATDFTLSLQMITKWDKSSHEPEVLHQCEESHAQALHPSPHDPNAPRLLCALQRNEQTEWSTFCLSDYIRPPKSSRKQTIEIIPSTHSKRLKTDS